MEEIKTKIVSVANMKGGVGKSTLTSVLCNYIFNEVPDASVVALDADDMQGSLSMLRERDLENLRESGGNADPEDYYDVVRVSSALVDKSIEQLIGKVDYIFIDLPGNLKQAGVIKSYMFVDHFIVPTGVNDIELDATMKFIVEVKNSIIPERERLGLETTLHMVLNKVKTNELEYKKFSESREDFESAVDMLKSELSHSATLSGKATTIETYAAKSKGFDFTKQFCEEVFGIIRNDK